MRRDSSMGSHGGDEGQTVLLALVFLVVMGLLIAAMLSQADVSLKTSSVVDSRTLRWTATDAAIDYGTGRLALDPTLCNDVDANGNPVEVTFNDPQFRPAPQTINNKPVTLKCKGITGTGLGAGGYSAIVYGALHKQGGGSPTLTGPVYVGGNIDIQGGGGLTVNNGNVYQHSASCPGTLTQPGGLTVAPNPPYSWQCTTASAPTIAHDLPNRPAPAPVALNPNANCRVFFPGSYVGTGSAAGQFPGLNGTENYFVSGLYYFEGIGNQAVSTVLGGTPRPPEVSDQTLSPCGGATDASVGGGSGYGVEFILGGNSSFTVGNGNKLELFTRYYGVGESDYTEKISVYAVPTTADGYIASTATNAIDTVNAQPTVSIHGTIYAPSVGISIDSPNNGTAAHGGIVAGSLTLKKSNGNAAPLAINGDTGNIVRTVVLTAYTTAAGEASAVSVAKVELRYTNPASPTPVIASWRKCFTTTVGSPSSTPVCTGTTG